MRLQLRNHKATRACLKSSSQTKRAAKARTSAQRDSTLGFQLAEVPSAAALKEATHSWHSQWVAVNVLSPQSRSQLARKKKRKVMAPIQLKTRTSSLLRPIVRQEERLMLLKKLRKRSKYQLGTSMMKWTTKSQSLERSQAEARRVLEVQVKSKRPRVSKNRRTS